MPLPHGRTGVRRVVAVDLPRVFEEQRDHLDRRRGGRDALDRGSLVSATDAFQMQHGTAIGSAIVVCLAELFPDQGIDFGEMTFGSRLKTRSRDAKDRVPPGRSRPWHQARTARARSSC